MELSPKGENASNYNSKTKSQANMSHPSNGYRPSKDAHLDNGDEDDFLGEEQASIVHMDGDMHKPTMSVDLVEGHNIDQYFANNQRGATREVMTFVIDSSGDGTFVDTSLRDLLNSIIESTTELDGDLVTDNTFVETPVPAVSANKDKERPALARRSTFRQVPPIEPLRKVDIDSYVSSLKLRDLRRLDFHFNPNDEKSFLVRRHVVLFAMDPLRAVIMWNKIILLVPQGADSILDRLQSHLKADKADKYPAFELHALDSLLRTVLDLERSAFVVLEEQIKRTLTYFKMGSLLSIDIQEEMRLLKNQLSLLTHRLELCRDTLEELTEDDEEMALMNLSVLKLKPILYKLPLVPEILATHDRSDELLETHLIDINAICSRSALLKTNIQNSEEMVSLKLDTSRNELLITNTSLTMISCGIGFGAYVTGVFGMNLDQTTYLQPRKDSFLIVTVLSFVSVVMLSALGYLYLKIAGILPERVTMPSGSSSTGR